MSVSLRHARPRDYDSIEAIENAADQLLVDQLAPERWEPAPPGSARAQEPGFLLVVAETAAGTILGFVHVLELPGCAHLEQLSVLPEHGRRGHGGRLVRAALAEAHARGYECVTLRTYADVPWNAPFYERAGFVETEPATEFHKGLVAVEERLGLDRYGRRVQMTATLPVVAPQFVHAQASPLATASNHQPVAIWRHGYPYNTGLSRRDYEREKRLLQTELLRLQFWVKETGQKIVLTV